jgi:dehydrogenase/reductase SDR family protein 1
MAIVGALRGKVAVVTGASRGMGKGVALGLGEAGATVYVTGRTVESGAAPFPGTVGETALAVDRLGGRGVAVRCDHRQDSEVEALFRRVEEEHGQLDILVNNAFGQPPDMSYGGVPFWELPVSLWDDLHSVGLRSHYVASHFAAPHMIAQSHGLIVNISSAGEARFMFNVPYSVGKAAVARLTQDTARELRPHGVAVVALWPGLTKTELVMANPQLAPLAERVGQSPQLTGRAVAALAADPAIIDKTGQSIDVRDVALAYGFTDLGGTLPPPR